MPSSVIPGLGTREDVPRPNPTVNPMAAGLSAQEGWVFSRVDGYTSLGDLFLITGLGEEQTAEILRRLVARKLVLVRDGVPDGAAPAAGTPAAGTSSSTKSGSVRRSPVPDTAAPRAAAPISPVRTPSMAPAGRRPPSPIPSTRGGSGPVRAQPAGSTAPATRPASIAPRTPRPSTSSKSIPPPSGIPPGASTAAALAAAAAAKGLAEQASRAAAAAVEAARTAGQAREGAVAEEGRRKREADERATAAANLEQAGREAEQLIAQSRATEDHARASVLALRDALVRAEMELSRISAEREGVARESQSALDQLAAARAAAAQAQSAAEAATRAARQAEKEEERARREASEKAEIAVRTEQAARDAENEARRVAHERSAAAARAAEEADRARLASMLRSYSAEEEQPAGVSGTPAGAEGSRRLPDRNAPVDEVPRERSHTVTIAPEQAEGLDIELLAQAPELPLEAKKRMVKKHLALATQDLFELLEISLECDKRDIKRAYFKLSKEFHPDRYFGKELGPFKECLQNVFKALSQAADFLSDDERRAEYQTMIHSQRELRDLEMALKQATDAALEEDRRLAAGEGPSEVRGVADGTAADAVPQSVSAPPSGGFAASPSEARAIGSGRWARKGSGERPIVGGAEVPGRAGPPPPPRAEAQAGADRPGSRLVQKMLSHRLTDERASKARSHFEEADRQARAGQWVTAAANFKLAATFVPDNADYAARLREAEAKAAGIQAHTHLRRGQFEEKAGRLDAAARCYELGARLAPSSEAFSRAADMFLKTRQLKKALEYGIKAVELEPVSVVGHLVLAQVFRESKQLVDARRSLERVLELDPQNKSAKDLLREVQKAT
jgi:curved DNA-binding protein CbpA